MTKGRSLDVIIDYILDRLAAGYTVTFTLYRRNDYRVKAERLCLEK
jgi:hypothetical protein